MKFKILAAGICMLLTVGGAIAQPAQPSNDAMWGKHPAMMHNKLKLTDEQKASIQKVKFEVMQKQIDLRAQIAHDRLDYEQLTSADSPDEDAIAAKIDDIAKLQIQLHKNLLHGWFAVNKVLTPEQQKIWKKVLQHPRMAARRMMMRMRGNGRNGSNGMMRWRNPRVGEGPMINGRQMSGEGQIWDDNSDFLGMNLGPMTDEDMFLDEDPFWDDAEMFDYPMMDNMGTTGDGIMEQGGSMQNRMEMMKMMMGKSAADSSK
ncbi:MAG: Spy/CpxP family protein refolding chaperone [Candidatus Kryptoniota bacterium]